MQHMKKHNHLQVTSIASKRIILQTGLRGTFNESKRLSIFLVKKGLRSRIVSPVTGNCGECRKTSMIHG